MESIKRTVSIASRGSTRLLHAILPGAALLSVLLLSPAQADDIDIFFTTGEAVDATDTSFEPNLLFIFDTSGSMASEELVSVPVFVTDYSIPEDEEEPAGEPNPCNDLSDYQPDCDYGSSAEGVAYVYDQYNEYLGFTIPDSKNNCQAMYTYHSTIAEPSFRDQIMVWERYTSFGSYRYRWVQLSQTILQGSTAVVDCADDRGVHGDGGTPKYLSNCYTGQGNSCSSSTKYVSSNGLASNRYGNLFGLYPANYHDYLLCVDGSDGCDTGILDANSGPDFPDSVSESYPDQDILYADVAFYGPFYMEGGSQFTATVSNWTGDPEVYVRFDDLPDTNDAERNDTGYAPTADCSVTSGTGTTRSCTATAASSDEAAFVMVVGGRISTYDLTVTFSPDEVPTDIATENDDTCDCSQDFDDNRRGSSSDSYNGVVEDDSGDSDYCDRVNRFVQSGYKTVCHQRHEMATDVLSDLFASVEEGGLSGMAAGLMRFNTDLSSDYTNGGRILQKVSSLNDTQRAELQAAVAGTLPNNSTPLAESLYEGALYYRGDEPENGAVSDYDTDVDDATGYITPIDHVCKSNNIILVTDGLPTSDSDENTNIRNLVDVDDCNDTYESGSSNSCLDELAGFLGTEDQSTNATANSNDLDGTQTVRVYTVGFAGGDPDLLTDAATSSGGLYFSASTGAELKNVFDNIIVDILSTASTFVAPAVSVNAFNELQHREQVYFALFEPAIKPIWNGNVKRYELDADGTITDVNGNLAVDEATGFFRNNDDEENGIQSWWSDEPDGANVADGGAAGELGQTRTVYMHTSSTYPTAEELADGTYSVLTDSANIFSTDNEAVTALFEAADDALSTEEITEIINWVRGDDPSSTEPDQFMADPLHTLPVVITYGGTAQAPDDTVFITTNNGMFMAIDTDTGSEVFSFVPKEMVPQLIDSWENDSAQSKVYGLDGKITPWVYESLYDDDKTISLVDPDAVVPEGETPPEEEFVRLYFNQRRGGTAVYALDVTDRANPALMWKVDSSTTGFEDMGQSWSTPQLREVYWGCDEDGADCEKKTVLMFAGGYDASHDTESLTEFPTDDIGNAVYMVDAVTGELLWSAGDGNGYDVDLDDMTHAIPATLETFDANGDGAMDMIFALDITGQLFRFDLNRHTTGADDFATGGKIADMGESGSMRRFYNKPDVVLSDARGQNAYLNVVFGSGYREHPRNDVEDEYDRLYAIFTGPVFGAPKDEDGDVAYSVVDAEDLYNANAEDADPASIASNAPHGYYLEMKEDGEKILDQSVTIQGKTIFTSYLPNGEEDADQCSGGLLGSGRLYIIDLATGRTVITDNDGAEVDYIVLDHAGIPPAPVTIFIENAQGDVYPVICVGTECFGEDDWENPLSEIGIAQKLYWRENYEEEAPVVEGGST